MHAEKFTPVPEGIYLLNHSVGRPPKKILQQTDEGFFELWRQEADAVWPRWLQQIDMFRDAIAELLNVDSEDICPQVNLSSALSKLLPALPARSNRDVIVYNEQDFPSMGFVLSRAQAAGYTLRCIPASRNASDLQTWADHFGPDVSCALITHVHSNTSRQVPVEEICALTRELEITSIVDVAQSVGVVPIDLGLWKPDFVLGSCVKWLCGGPGAGFLWANPDIIAHCEPVDVGWFSHIDPFEFDIHDFRFAERVLRFWGGTPSVIPYVVAANSIKLIASIGVETIRNHNLTLNQRILDAIPADVPLTPIRPELRGGTLVLNFGVRQAPVEAALRAATIHFDSRPTGLRLSPHIYNSVEEIDTVIDCLLKAD